MQNDTTVFVGLDLHKDSITAACIGSDPSEPLRIPADAGPSFRGMPGRDSGPCRATVPEDAGPG